MIGGFMLISYSLRLWVHIIKIGLASDRQRVRAKLKEPPVDIHIPFHYWPEESFAFRPPIEIWWSIFSTLSTTPLSSAESGSLFIQNWIDWPTNRWRNGYNRHLMNGLLEHDGKIPPWLRNQLIALARHHRQDWWLSLASSEPSIWSHKSRSGLWGESVAYEAGFVGKGKVKICNNKMGSSC